MLKQQPFRLSFSHTVDLKKLLTTKPLALILSFFLAALLIFLLFRVPYTHLFFFLLLGVAILLLPFLLKQRDKPSQRYLSVLLLFVLFLSIASLEASVFTARIKRIEASYHGTTQTASFLVSETVYYDGAVRLVGQFTRIGDRDERVKATVMLFASTETDLDELSAGDTLSGAFYFESTDGEGLLGKASLADGILLSATATDSPRLVGHTEKPLFVKLALIRNAVGKALDTALTEDGASMMRALLLADKSGIDSEVKEGFSTLGISHLFAVSGLHLSILMGMLAFLFEKLELRKPLAYPILAVVTLSYILLTGFAPSMLRAGGMLLLFYLSRFSRRHRDSITSLLVATSLIVILSPNAILDAGLLMSFAATGGILVIGAPCLRAIGEKRLFRSKKRSVKLMASTLSYLLSSVVLSLSATAAILPILYLMKERVFFFVFLSNLVFTPFFSLLIFLMPLVLLFLPIRPIVFCLSWLINGLTRAVYAMALWGKNLSALSFSLDYPFIPFLIALLFLTFVFILTRKKKHVYLPLVSILLFFLIANLGILIADLGLKGSESVYYTTDKKNDRLEITYEDKGLMIDFSASGSFLTEGITSPMERSPSVTLDSLMLTSCRALHLAPLTEFFRDETLNHLILPNGTAYSDTFAALAEGYGVSVTRYTPGDTVLWNGIVITTYPDQSETSLAAVRIETSHKDFLYIKENAPMQFDIRFGVLAAHHDVLFYGSYGSAASGQPFVFDADLVVEGGDTHYVKKSHDYLILYESEVFTDSRKQD